MEIVFFISGLGVTLLAMVDLIWTTLWIDGGAGPISKRIARITWFVTKKISKNGKGLFNLVGPLILVFTLVGWVLLLWAGLTLLFSGDPESIVKTTFDGPVMWSERVYFTGFSLFTLGVGDYSPKPGFWQIVTAVSSGMGILFLTLGASYTISVISAVVKKRAVARTISGLGVNSEEIIEKAWNGKNFYQLDLFLMNVSSQITELTQQHQAYPLLHYYHSEKPEESSAVGIAILDDMLSILHFGLNDRGTVNITLLNEARSSIGTYLETMTSAFIKESSSVPSIPDLNSLDQLNVPLVSEETFTDQMERISKRRKQLLGAVEADNHKWP